MKKALSLLLCLLMLSTAVSVQASAAETIDAGYIPVPDFYDSDELFQGYVEKSFYPEYEVSLFGNAAGNRLGATAKKLYDALRERIISIANGKTNDATIIFTGEQLKSWGVDITYDRSQYDSSAAFSDVDKQLQIDVVINALLWDLPYEFYWFDKTNGWGHGVSFNGGYSEIEVNEYFMRFSVANEYQAINYDAEKPKASKTKTSATSNAVANAQKIIDKYASYSDKNKLSAYKSEICDLVSYNYDAAGGGVFYGDPWQLIYVFDGDPETNVVCEGYSKAFQFLCDKSTFQSKKVACYSITGATLYDGQGGGHMWNIVTMDDGKNYLVDITNSDEGAIGYISDALFLSGADGSINGGYTFSFAKPMTYYYGEEFISFWGDDASSILNLSAEDYRDLSAHVCIPWGTGWYSDDEVHYRMCECGNELDMDYHNGEWKIVEPAQIGIEGKQEYRCTTCNYLLDTETIPALEKPAFVRGDVNLNGKIDSRDYLLLKRAYFGTTTLNETAILAADVNINDKIDSRDYMLLKRAYFGTYTIQ